MQDAYTQNMQRSCMAAGLLPLMGHRVAHKAVSQCDDTPPVHAGVLMMMLCTVEIEIGKAVTSPSML